MTEAVSQAYFVFVGICTHIPRINLTPSLNSLSPSNIDSNFFTRAVVPNASLGLNFRDRQIPPHEAQMFIPQQFLAEVPEETPGLERVTAVDSGIPLWRLQGVNLYVADARAEVGATVGEQGQPLQTSSFQAVPSLTQAAGVLSLSLDPRVVKDGRAAATVDLFAGVMDAYTNFEAEQAVHVTYRVLTSATNPRLVVTRIRDGQQCTFTLKQGVIDGFLYDPRIFITNTGIDSDMNVDFVLSYYVTTYMPSPNDMVPFVGNVSGVRQPTHEELRLLRVHPQGTTLGCSNSTYP